MSRFFFNDEESIDIVAPSNWSHVSKNMFGQRGEVWRDFQNSRPGNA